MRWNRKLGTALASFFSLIILGYLWIAPRIYDSAVHGTADFSTFYTAGLIVKRGLGERLYDLELQSRVQSEFSQATALRQKPLPYLRPPFEVILFLPLVSMPYPRAFGVWIAFCTVLVISTAMLLRSQIPDHPAIPWWLYYPAVLSFFPVAFGLALGQDASLLLFLFACVTIFLRKGKDFLAGCFLALALIKFQLVLPMLVIWIVKRQFRALAGFATVCVPLMAVGIWILGWKGLSTYPAYLWRLNRVPPTAGIWPCMMPTVRGLLQGWGDMRSSPLLNLMTLLISLGALAWVANLWQTTAPRQSNLYVWGLANVFLVTLLAGYHASTYDMVLLIPVVVQAANAGLLEKEFDRTTRAMLLVGAAILFYAPLYTTLLAHGQMNLLAVPVMLLVWGFARATRIWSAGAVTPRQQLDELPI